MAGRCSFNLSSFRNWRLYTIDGTGRIVSTVVNINCIGVINICLNADWQKNAGKIILREIFIGTTKKCYMVYRGRESRAVGRDAQTQRAAGDAPSPW